MPRIDKAERGIARSSEPAAHKAGVVAPSSTPSSSPTAPRAKLDAESTTRPTAEKAIGAKRDRPSSRPVVDAGKSPLATRISASTTTSKKGDVALPQGQVELKGTITDPRARRNESPTRAATIVVDMKMKGATIKMDLDTYGARTLKAQADGSFEGDRCTLSKPDAKGARTLTAELVPLDLLGDGRKFTTVLDPKATSTKDRPLLGDTGLRQGAIELHGHMEARRGDDSGPKALAFEVKGEKKGAVTVEIDGRTFLLKRSADGSFEGGEVGRELTSMTLSKENKTGRRELVANYGPQTFTAAAFF